jgi:hypothetical protein
MLAVRRHLKQHSCLLSNAKCKLRRWREICWQDNWSMNPSSSRVSAAAPRTSLVERARSLPLLASVFCSFGSLRSAQQFPVWARCFCTDRRVCILSHYLRLFCIAGHRPAIAAHRKNEWCVQVARFCYILLSGVQIITVKRPLAAAMRSLLVYFSLQLSERRRCNFADVYVEGVSLY